MTRSEIFTVCSQHRVLDDDTGFKRPLLAWPRARKAWLPNPLGATLFLVKLHLLGGQGHSRIAPRLTQGVAQSHPMLLPALINYFISLFFFFCFRPAF